MLWFHRPEEAESFQPKPGFANPKPPPDAVAPEMAEPGKLPEQDNFEGELRKLIESLRRVHCLEMSRQLVSYENELARLREALSDKHRSQDEVTAIITGNDSDSRTAPSRKTSAGCGSAEPRVIKRGMSAKARLSGGSRTFSKAWDTEDQGTASSEKMRATKSDQGPSSAKDGLKRLSSSSTGTVLSKTTRLLTRKVTAVLAQDSPAIPDEIGDLDAFAWRPSYTRAYNLNVVEVRTERYSFIRDLAAKISVNPDGNLMVLWDLLCGLLLIVVGVITPFEAGFLQQEHALSPLWVWNQFVNLIFFFDMVLQFVHPVKVNTRYGNRYLFKKRHIAMNYIRTWFLIDFISVIPFQLLLSGHDKYQVTTVNRAARLLRLVKLLRLLRGFRIFRRYQEKVSFSYRKNALYILFSSMLLVAHWIACALGLLNRLQDPGLCELDASPECGKTWLSAAYREWMLDADVSTVSVTDAYLFSMHTSMSILVHPHTNMPTNSGEMVSFAILMLLGGFVWTQVLSRSTALFASLERANMHYRQTMDDINILSADLGISRDLQQRLRSFFMNTNSTTKYETWSALVQRMSPQLRRDVAREINKTWLMQIHFIARCKVTFKTDISAHLRLAAFADKEFFGECFHLYILMQGYCLRQREAIIEASGTPRVVIPGTAWGSEHLLLTNVELLEPNTAIALHFAQCQTLWRKDFDMVLERYPEYWKSYRRCVVKCAFVRGIKCMVLERRRLTCKSVKGRESGKTSELDVSKNDSNEEDEHLNDGIARLARRQTEIRRGIMPLRQMVQNSWASEEDRKASKKNFNVAPTKEPTEITKVCTFDDEQPDRKL